MAGDVTTEAIVAPDASGRGVIAARKAGVVAGLAVAARAFEIFDPAVRFDPAVCDGAHVGAGDVLAAVEGPARSLLTAERTALNLLGRLSGIATATAEVVELVAGTRAFVTCTRKTTPGLRVLEKYAVRAGGGSNHRFGLDDAVLVKDNHLVLAGSVTEAVRRVRARVGHMVKIEVEVDSLEQLDELLEVGADAVLLDNLGPERLRSGVEKVAGRLVTEASGGITPATARGHRRERGGPAVDRLADAQRAQPGRRPRPLNCCVHPGGCATGPHRRPAPWRSHGGQSVLRYRFARSGSSRRRVLVAEGVERPAGLVAVGRERATTTAGAGPPTRLPPADLELDELDHAVGGPGRCRVEHPLVDVLADEVPLVEVVGATRNGGTPRRSVSSSA